MKQTTSPHVSHSSSRTERMFRPWFTRMEQFTATIISHDQFPPPSLRPKPHIIRAGNQALTAVQARVSKIFNHSDPAVRNLQ